MGRTPHVGKMGNTETGSIRFRKKKKLLQLATGIFLWASENGYCYVTNAESERGGGAKKVSWEPSDSDRPGSGKKMGARTDRIQGELLKDC